MKQKRWLSILLSLSLLLTLLPVRAFAEEGTQTACTQAADCPAQVHEPDCPLWQEGETVPEETEAAGPDSTEPGETDPGETVPDSTKPEETAPTVPGETGPDGTEPDETVPEETDATEETQPTAAEVLARIEALPDPSDLTAENAAAVEAQLKELLALYQALDEAGQEEVGDAILRAIELKAALDALSGEDSGQAMLAEIATDVAYINAAYDETTNTVTYKTETAESATVVDENTTEWAWGVAGQETWYVVQDTATTSDRITVTGDVHLILADGYTLTASAGINVPEGSSLTIYGQTDGTGKLIANGGSDQAGIGGNQGSSISTAGNCGSITINGGVVSATGGRGGGAGIGGGYMGDGTVTINGGVVSATGGADGAGIGSGFLGSGTVTIHGGTVTAKGGTSSAGIGNGCGDSLTATITISGGVVSATGGSDGAGIGGGAMGSGNVTISGGTVTAKGGSGGAGIGTGSGSFLTATITISGGFVAAQGGETSTWFAAGAAIGSGGARDSSSAGAEADESSFTNAVVLRQSGASGSTLTGTVYGDATLTTNATVPTGATLTVPEGSTLTIDKGVTLTNNGEITNNGTIRNGGTITGTGTINGNPVQVEVEYQAYNEADGSFSTQKAYATPVTSSMTAWGETGKPTWYVVNSAAANDLTISDRIIVSGDVHLILADGAKLTASKGIGVNTADNSLTIYGQTEGTGELVAGTPDNNNAGIGGDNSKSSGAITINGGTVKATGGYYGAGIGSGYGGGSAIIAIHGGTVNATGGYYGAGIGRGYGGGGSITITISGGTVTAKGGDNSVGIGGYKGTVTIINGGTVNATGGEYGAGIGGGVAGTATVTINGGTVNATGGDYGAGIGGSSNANVTVTINGGFVAATGGQYSAAIGSGGVASSNTGTEATFTSDDTNAVVLRKSAATGQVMTGQVYGEPTLTTDATVPAGAALTVPEGTTLTIDSDTTLTNNGTIIIESGGELTNNGTILNNGTIIKNGTINGTVTGNQPQVQVTYQAYNEKDGTFSEKTAVATAVTSSSTAWGTENTETWYVVDSDVTISDRITVSGDVHLILADGKTLNANKGITVTGGNSLTIYGQEKGTGKLVADGGYNYNAGIGGEGKYGSGSNITINGGTVEATGGIAGAGIGGSYGGSGSNITINGGTVTANGRNGAASIGGGSFEGSGSNITIRGGFVTAQGDNGAGIGGGENGSGSYITISGGTVTATGDEGAGIGGGGSRGSGSYITITGGTVTATGGVGGAGIGGSENSSGSNITISGGTVTATGSGGGAGIGGGTAGSGSDITISGGFVTAQGGNGWLYGYRYSGGGAAIGNGGSRSYEDGAESDNFTDCVVLRQSGSETTMTGQVYNNCTLTTDATVPVDATLTIPSDSTLTIGPGTTLTNPGTIINQGAITGQGHSLSNTSVLISAGGTIGDNVLTEDSIPMYYSLTVTGGIDATVETDDANQRTVNNVLYIKAGATVTITADEEKVGQTAIFSYKLNNEDSSGSSFTMPAQALTVTAGYTNAPAYTVTIPASVDIGKTAEIKAESVNVAQDYSLKVKLTATSGTANAFTLALENHSEETLAYTVTQNKQNVNVNDTVLTVAGGTANSSGTATLTFALADTVKYAGEYSGTVTFTVSVEKDASTGGTP
ncbi:MAG: hypothetical protein Q4D50_05250 [Eubacteriales bacterium]|nr:hypothetical protein [Eubacteriales bacterium]